jgi:hypothetical protein
MKTINVLSKILILIGFISVLSSTSCKKDDEPCHPDEYLKIDSTEEKKVPYSGTDTLRFYYHDSSVKDTVRYIGSGRKYEKDIEVETMGSQDEGCIWHIYGERYTVKYVADTTGMDLLFKIETYSGGSHFQITTSGESIEDGLYAINWDKYQGFYQEKEVNDKLYHRVNFFQTYDMVLYYTSDEGIIRIEIPKENKVWELID